MSRISRNTIRPKSLAPLFIIGSCPRAEAALLRCLTAQADTPPAPAMALRD
jgi:hypothetical protein